MDRQTRNIFIFLLLVVIGVVIAFRRYYTLEANYRISSGTIHALQTFPQSPGIFAVYTFSVNNQVVTAKGSIPSIKKTVFRSADSIFRKAVLPVVYDSNDVSNSKMLFWESDFKKYGIRPTLQQQRMSDHLRHLSD